MMASFPFCLDAALEVALVTGKDIQKYRRSSLDGESPPTFEQTDNPAWKLNFREGKWRLEKYNNGKYTFDPVIGKWVSSSGRLKRWQFTVSQYKPVTECQSSPEPFSPKSLTPPPCLANAQRRMAAAMRRRTRKQQQRPPRKSSGSRPEFQPGSPNPVFHAPRKDSTADYLFEDMDVNASGNITFLEFLEWMDRKDVTWMSTYDRKKLYDYLDRSCRGRMTKVELRRYTLKGGFHESLQKVLILAGGTSRYSRSKRQLQPKQQTQCGPTQEDITRAKEAYLDKMLLMPTRPKPTKKVTFAEDVYLDMLFRNASKLPGPCHENCREWQRAGVRKNTPALLQSPRSRLKEAYLETCLPNVCESVTRIAFARSSEDVPLAGEKSLPQLRMKSKCRLEF